MPGGDCRLLYSLLSTILITLCVSPAVPSESPDIRKAQFLFDIRLEYRIKLVIGRKTVGILLSRLELCSRLFPHHPVRDDSPTLQIVPPSAESYTRVFGTSLITANPPAISPYSVHIPRSFQIYCLCKHQPTEFVGECHEKIAANACLQVLFRGIAFSFPFK